MTNTIKQRILLLATVAVVAVFILLNTNKTVVNENVGNVGYGDECTATTTSAVFTSATETLLKTGQGTLCSVIQTVAGSAGGNFLFYNATTSDVSKRTGNKATSTILVASLPTNATVGAYPFNASFTDGLLVTKSGTVGTTTFTYK